ncbi:DUF2721 domain-containing protein [Spirochaeta lutea]|uniref:Membrane protein n=1 Tax=Spirochaeta lutea TaxID=1480694 RepID=A0A098QYL2_9SPIO|nr:DUF2721 domain-containing protein [Spirochaeta lutea]KGE71577.1 membrane protein [Spirochaeta lutea]
MQLTLETPGLLFPALSLLMLAYTNRFLTLANLIRELYDRYHHRPDAKVLAQISNLRRRIALVKSTQILGVTSLLLCVITMVLLFVTLETLGRIVFGLSLLAMATSLVFSVRELFISAEALTVHLQDLEKDCSTGTRGCQDED